MSDSETQSTRTARRTTKRRAVSFVENIRHPIVAQFGAMLRERLYNPLRNEPLKKDAARGVIQTNVKKYLDEATKTKMTWLEGFQAADQVRCYLER